MTVRRAPSVTFLDLDRGHMGQSEPAGAWEKVARRLVCRPEQCRRSFLRDRVALMDRLRTLICLAALPLVAAAQQKTSCPLVLPKETVTVNAPAGWRGYSSSIVRLTGFGMMAGPPESMTYLVPWDSKKHRQGSTSTWKFAGGDEKWLYCTYDGSAAIQISKRLDDSATECRLSYREDRPGNIIEMEAVCRH